MDTTNTTTKNPFGPVVGIMVIVAIIIVGGVYFWNQRIENVTNNSTDETAEIESDLNAANFLNIDSGSEQLQ